MDYKMLPAFKVKMRPRSRSHILRVVNPDNQKVIPLRFFKHKYSVVEPREFN